jgi:hypothetical protein
MPEVIEREVFKHGVVMGRGARAEIEKHLRTIRALIGQSPGVELPSDEQFESAVMNVLSNLRISSIEYHLPSTSPSARWIASTSSIHPLTRGQQHEDSAIWEHCLDLAEEFEVHLVTADKAFYQQNSFQKAPEERLRDELSARGVIVEIHQSMKLQYAAGPDRRLHSSRIAGIPPAPPIRSAAPACGLYAANPVRRVLIRVGE